MKKIIVSALLLAVLAGSAFAQAVQGGWQSPQSFATVGRMRSTADNFIRPDAFAGAGIKDWYAMTAFGSVGNNYLTNLGYAKNMENLYIGVYYGGNLWGGLNAHNYTETSVADWSPDNVRKTVPVYAAAPTMGNPQNTLAVLLGVGDMGFRLSLMSTYQGFNQSDARIAGTDYKNYEAGNGAITPELAWSMTKNLTSNGIRPYAVLDVAFNNNFLRNEVFGTTGMQTTNSQNSIRPQLEVGLGGYNLANLNGFRVSADVDYRLTFFIYNNEYSYIDGGSYKTDKISGLNNNGTFSENTSMTNRLRPSIAGQWSNENFAFRTRLRLALNYVNTSSQIMTLNAENKLQKNGAGTKVDNLNMNPELELAMQWRVVPKLTLNAGGLINFGTLGMITTNGETYAANSKVSDSDTKGVQYTLTNGTNQLRLGVTLLPTNYLTFEASCGVRAGNSVSVFADDGLFNFTNILVSFRF